MCGDLYSSVSSGDSVRAAIRQTSFASRSVGHPALIDACESKAKAPHKIRRRSVAPSPVSAQSFEVDVCKHTFQLYPVLWGQDCGHHLKFGVRVIKPVQTHHVKQLDASRRAHGSSCEPHIACFCSGYQCPSLRMSHCDKMLAVSLRQDQQW